MWDHPAAVHRSVSQLPGHRAVTGGTFCPRSFDDVEMGDQQANTKKANMIFNFLGGDFGTETIKRGAAAGGGEWV